jgi:hemolysin D
MRSRERPPRRRRDEREFLPAVLELEETPPSPAGRVLLWAIVTLFGLAVLWACLGEIDVVASAPGRIVPSGRVKVVQPAESGVIRAIHVAEGQGVEAGEVLVELDPTATEADAARISKELAAARLTLARLTLLTEALNPEPRREGAPPTAPAAPAAGASSPRFHTPDPALPDAPGGPASLAALPPVQRRILGGQVAEFRARIASLDQALAERAAAHQAARETLTKLEWTLPLVTRRVDALKALADRQMGATAEYLTLEQERVEQAQDLKVQEARVREIEAAIARGREERAMVEAEYLRARYEERAEAGRRVEALVEELAKARQRARLQTLTAPVAGVVQQLAVYTPGGVVTPAQALMTLVPREDRLEVEARLPNRDVGFVAEGQPAEVKVETFPFTRYGTIEAEITDVADDAVADEKTGLVYPVRARLARAVMEVDGRLVALAPGMAVTLEVRTGTRRVIEFALSPLLRGLRESARER